MSKALLSHSLHSADDARDATAQLTQMLKDTSDPGELQLIQ
jgi:hypothetical protein